MAPQREAGGRAGSPPSVTRVRRTAQQRSEELAVSILVHIVTHADVQATLRFRSEGELLARPRFSEFKRMGAAIAEYVARETTAIRPITYRSTWSRDAVTVGFELEPPLKMRQIKRWRLRSKDWDRVSTEVEQDLNAEYEVQSLYFPLLSVVLRHWMDFVPTQRPAQWTPSRPKRFLYLVSGVGTPRNDKHDTTGNSTKTMAELMTQCLVKTCYPNVEVQIVHSGVLDMFSYRQNVAFMNATLQPQIAKHRMGLAARFGERWDERFHLMVAVLSGPAARSHALNAAMRQFRPDYLHLSENKTFWHGYPHLKRLWDNDIEFIRFHTAESTPGLEIESLDANAKMLVEAMMDHKSAFEETVRLRSKTKGTEQGDELLEFWLRKTGKPVLSVLMVIKDGTSEPVFYKGVNMEVSMPTGSLCAERSAIGNALSTDPHLKRQEMKMIAVLSMSLDINDYVRTDNVDMNMMRELSVLSPPIENVFHLDSDTEEFKMLPPDQSTKPVKVVGKAANPIEPCGACNEWIKKIASSNPDFKIVTFDSMSCRYAFVNPVIL